MEAMDKMDGDRIDGRDIRVAMARYGRPTNDSRQQSRYGGSRGRDRYGGSGGYGGRSRRDSSPPRR